MQVVENRDGMQGFQNQNYGRVQEPPMLSFNNQRRMVDPVSNYTSTHVSPRLQTPSLFCGLRLRTVIWIFISGVLAILAICLGAVLGSELQRSRNPQYVKTLIPSISDLDHYVPSLSA